MSGDSSNSNIPDGLTPVGGLKPIGGGPTPAPGTAAPSTPPPPPLPSLTGPTRFNASPPTPGAPPSRFDTPSGAPAPRLADPSVPPVPQLSASRYTDATGRPYSAAEAMVTMRREIPDLTPGRIAAGIGLGVLVGLVGVVLWGIIVAVTHFNIAYIAIGIGWAIGWAVYKGCGQGTETVCWIGGIIAFIFICLGALVTHEQGFTGWGIFFSLVCIIFGTQRGFATPGVLGSQDI